MTDRGCQVCGELARKIDTPRWTRDGKHVCRFCYGKSDPDPDLTRCPECGGEGGFQDGPACSSRCDWCGGCYDAVPCERCKGTGEVTAQCGECGGDIYGGTCRDCSD